MKKYMIASIIGLISACGTSQVSETDSTNTTSVGGTGGTSSSSSSSSSLTTSSSGGEEFIQCPDPSKSWDEMYGGYVGAVYPFSEEVPGAAAEYVWGPWDTDVKVVSYTIGWGNLDVPIVIRSAYWRESDPIPTDDPNDYAIWYDTSDNTISQDGVVNVNIVPSGDFIVKAGDYVITAGLYDDNSDNYAGYKPSCSDDRTYYWRPLGCDSPKGDPGPHHAMLSDTICVDKFFANYAFTITVVPQ